MDSDQFGLWAMLAFWASGIGGIFLGLQWAKSKRKKSPAPKDVILKSLQQRLERGEIDQDEYAKRVAEQENSRRD
jgi:putative membrane protein